MIEDKQQGAVRHPWRTDLEKMPVQAVEASVDVQGIPGFRYIHQSLLWPVRSWPGGLVLGKGSGWRLARGLPKEACPTPWTVLARVVMNDTDPHQGGLFHHCEFLEHWDKERVLKTSRKGKERERGRLNRKWLHIMSQYQRQQIAHLQHGAGGQRQIAMLRKSRRRCFLA